jgi:uncharacterized ubiquitin-like protein YukD
LALGKSTHKCLHHTLSQVTRRFEHYGSMIDTKVPHYFAVKRELDDVVELSEITTAD